jgi:hypothetical protein
MKKDEATMTGRDFRFRPYNFQFQPYEPHKVPKRALIAAGVALALGLLGYYLITNRPWEDNGSRDLAGRVQQSVQHQLDTDQGLAQYHLSVPKITVIWEFGNDYQGLATIRTKKGTERNVPIHVTADKDNMIWRTDPGAFLFAAQEQYSNYTSTGGS